MSEPTVDRDAFEVVAESFLKRYRAGQRPSVEDLAARHPELADQIRELLPALVMVEQDLTIDPDPGPSGPQPPLAPSPGNERRLGDYCILREIGRGGMGVVYEAEQVSLGRRVALKVLSGNVANDRMALERFRREAKAAARLHHTNIVPVFEVGRAGEVAYYAMQFIQGQGLDKVIDELARLRDPERTPGVVEGPGPTETAAAPGVRKPALGRVAESLLTGRFATEGAASSGDIPPAAVTGPAATERLDRDATHTSDFSLSDPEPVGSGPTTTPGPAGSAMLPDGSQVSPSYLSGRRARFFRGVAQIGRQAAQGLAYAHASGIVHRDIKPSNLLLDHAGVVWIADFGLAKGEDEGLTQSGDILGTLRYMAPERFRGEGDARADLYALGMTLYELLTLRPGFDSVDRLKLIEQIKSEEPARPRSVDGRIPRDIETIVLKAIEKDPKARYQSAEALAEDLRRFLADEPIRARQASVSERYWRWARRNRMIAVMGGLLTALLIAVTIVSLVAAGRFASLAERASHSATTERSARLEADQAREAAETARTDAQAETYHAVLSETRALRVGHPPGWREEALSDLARLAVMPTPRRDLPELRTEAATTLATPDIHLMARVELPPGDLYSFAFSPDGRTLLTAGHKTGLDFWDVPGHRHLSSVKGLTVSESFFGNAVYLADGHGIAVGTRDHGVVFTDTQGVRTTHAPITLGSSRPTKLALSADGHRIAVAWTDGAGITVHDVASGDLLDRFNDSAFALSPDGRWLALQEGSDIVLRPIAPGEPRIVLGRHGGASAMTFSPDGALLAVAFLDHSAVLWEVAKCEQFGALRGHHERVLDVSFSPDGEWMATGSFDNTTRIWETRTGQNVATVPSPGPAFRVRWSPTGEYLATLSHNSREIFLYGITGRHRVQQWLTGHRVELKCVAAHPRRERIVTSGYTELNSWDLSASRPSPVVMEPNPAAGYSVAYSPDGSLLATASWVVDISHTRKSFILIRDGSTGKVRSRISQPETVSALAFDPTSERLACGDLAGHVVVWDLVTSRHVQRFVTGAFVWSIVYLDRPRRLVTHGRDALLLFNLETGQLEKKVDLGGGNIRNFVADPARSRLVVGFWSGAIGSVSLPDLTTGPRLEKAHNGSVDCLAVSPDGLLLATGGDDHRVVLRDGSSLERLLDFPLWVGNVRDLTFDFKGRRLAIVGTGCDVDLWDLAALDDGLMEIGLAWDRPAPAVVTTSGLASAGNGRQPAVPVMRRPGATGQAAPERAR